MSLNEQKATVIDVIGRESFGTIASNLATDRMSLKRKKKKHYIYIYFFKCVILFLMCNLNVSYTLCSND